MNVKSVLRGGCAVLLLSALAGPVLAENARLPYHLLYNAQKARMELNLAHTNLLVMLTMQSTLPDVKTSDLTVNIDAKGGKIPVEIGVGGDFTISMREALLAEDPWVVINQPKGTMKLSVQVGVIPGPLGHSLHYKHVMLPVRESQEVQDQLRSFFPGSPRQVMTGLRLTFPAAQGRPVVVIHAKGGDRKLEADDHGEIILPLEDALLEENPVVTLSNTPGTVEIVSH
ncbi:MAG: hypothetical protein ABSA83_00820 [Verrucomicrobiota bacterium]|jgi:hypothetical protein